MTSRDADAPAIDLPEVMAVATAAAKEAGSLILPHAGDAGGIEFKGAVDIVTAMDKKSERLITSAIKASFPEHGILAEESDEERSTSPYRWIIDPIDGTTNYAHGFPFFCVSIAFEYLSEVLLGVVYDPSREELFTAIKGRGALLNGRPLKVSDRGDLNDSLLATGFPYDIRTSKDNNLDHFASFAVRAQAIRRAGSAALDLAYVAAGRFDGYWEIKLQPWDIAAASLMVTEAGGRVSDFEGASSSIHNKRLLATNGLLHPGMMAILSEEGKLPASGGTTDE